PHDPVNDDSRGVFGYPPAFFASAGDFASATSIKLTPGQTFQASVTPVRRQYFSVKVKVLNAPAENAGGLQIRVAPLGHPGPGYSLGYNPNDGLIQGSLPEGSYSLLVASMGGNVLSGETNLTVSPGPPVLQTLTLAPASPLLVRIRNEY